MMIAQVMQGQQVMRQEQMQIQTERQLQTESHMHFERLKKAHMSIFDENSGPEQTEKWISELEGNFEVVDILEEVKATVVKPLLVSKAEKWWKNVALANKQPGKNFWIITFLNC